MFTECGFERVVGFNLFSCRCGKNMAFEFHSVNKKDGVLYDFTKDFNDSIEKYFLEIHTDNTAMEVLRLLMDKTDFYINKGCRCNIIWKTPRHFIADYEFEEIIEEIEKV